MLQLANHIFFFIILQLFCFIWWYSLWACRSAESPFLSSLQATPKFVFCSFSCAHLNNFILSSQERKIAILLYGFPPGVGATGTAALLNVPASLANLLGELEQQGYNLGPDWQSGMVDGEAIVTALKMQEEQRAIYEGKAGIEKRCVPGLVTNFGQISFLD